MAFFNSAVNVLQTLVIALGAGLGVWGGSLIEHDQMPRAKASTQFVYRECKYEPPRTGSGRYPREGEHPARHRHVAVAIYTHRREEGYEY